ncbi:uncharacterized protein [Chlorocebus sabaeus]|uniref:uncharacterized protein isoform X2 n=1 Tax=Chlorocebus sabaeus TaxID=60711 RepID=UPI003BF9C3B2
MSSCRPSAAGSRPRPHWSPHPPRPAGWGGGKMAASKLQKRRSAQEATLNEPHLLQGSCGKGVSLLAGVQTFTHLCVGLRTCSGKGLEGIPSKVSQEGGWQCRTRVGAREANQHPGFQPADESPALSFLRPALEWVARGDLGSGPAGPADCVALQLSRWRGHSSLMLDQDTDAWKLTPNLEL